MNKAQRFWALIAKAQCDIMNACVPGGAKHAKEIRVHVVTHVVTCTWVNDNRLHTITIDEQGSVIRRDNA